MTAPTSTTAAPATAEPAAAPGLALAVIAAALAAASILPVTLGAVGALPHAFPGSFACLVGAWIVLAVDAWRRGFKTRLGALRGAIVGTLPLALPVFLGLGPFGVLAAALAIAVVWAVVAGALSLFVHVETPR